MTSFGLEGKTLHAVAADYTVRLQMTEGYVVVIESDFSLAMAGHTITLSPESATEDGIEPVRQLIGQRVTSADADEAGALIVRFSGGTDLLVAPDADYEAWHVSSPDGALVVCTPGGRLAVWSKRE